MTLRKHGEGLEDVRFGVYVDVSWGIRPDGASEGGYVIFATTNEELQSGKPWKTTSSYDPVSNQGS